MWSPIDVIKQPRPEERAVARVSKDGHKRDRARGHPSRRPREERGLLVRNLGLGGGARPLGRANRPLRSGGEWLDFDGIAKVFKALHQALGLRDLGTAVEMVGTEILVDGSVLEHVVDGGENGGGDGTDGFLWPAAAAQAQVLSLVIASL